MEWYSPEQKAYLLKSAFYACRKDGNTLDNLTLRDRIVDLMEHRCFIWNQTRKISVSLPEEDMKRLSSKPEDNWAEIGFGPPKDE